MRSIAPYVDVVTRGVLLATLVTLVGCGGTSLRRPLVTDQTPLGTPREQVRAWYAANGWCGGVDQRHPDRDLYRPCRGIDRHRLATQLGFLPDGRLAAAVVYVRVPIDESPSFTPLWFGKGEPLSTHHEPGSVGEPPGTEPLRRPPPARWEADRATEEMAVALIDALAVEIEARHGEHTELAPFAREWKTAREYIFMFWMPQPGGGWVVEAHVPPPAPCCAPAKP